MEIMILNIKNSLCIVLCLCVGLVSSSSFFTTNIKASEVYDVMKGQRDLKVKASLNGVEVSAGFSETEIAFLVGGIALIGVLLCTCLVCCVSACCCRRKRETTIVYSQMPSTVI